MALSKREFTQYIREFKFRELFNDMGWNKDKTTQPITVDTLTFSLQGIAEKSGFKILLCSPTAEGIIPEYSIRKKIETKVTKLFQEHLIIFFDAKNQEQIWQLVVRQSGKPSRATETRYHISQDPQLLFQRASGIFFELDEEENITIVDVTQRVTENFHQNNEKVTKQFYDKFSKEHSSFLKFIKGIEDNVNKEWYASLMLNRLMFCYFIQKKGFLDNKKDYLRDKLKTSQEKKGKNKFYSFYRSFLMTLFHQGLGAPDHKKELTEEIGKVPYLNGGLFEEHELEATNPKIDIDDKAFEHIFDFFDQYEWHLDTRTTASGKDINPDVIGYIFEKYINDRADMGAYYTKEDITDYISKNCVLPFLFDETERNYAKAFASEGDLGKMVKKSGDQYIYDAVKKGVQQEVPKEIAKGIKDVAARAEWNKPAPAEFALPTEIWREVMDRRDRYAELKAKIEKGEILTINDFITYNLNISQFVQDVIEDTNDPEFLKAFYESLNSVTIIDPTCGSGAFLFAAMNILEPLYEASIMRMRAFVEDEDRINKEEKKTFSHKHKYFREVLENIQSPQHPNLQYFVYKSIILRNLYGVDIMKEAVEIAKLRLFLKLVATVEADHKKPNLGLEPLPDIDFNIRAGNTLVGFATQAELKKGGEYTFDFDKNMPVIEEKCEIVAKTFAHYKDIQLYQGDDYKEFKKAKDELNKRIKELNYELNQLLYKQTQSIKYNEWLETHQPFHWFAEFYEIIQERGGFNVVIGNPPYVVYTEKKCSYKLINDNFKTLESKNLYAFVFEQSSKISSAVSKIGLIVPLTAISSENLQTLQDHLMQKGILTILPFPRRPESIFESVEMPVVIILLAKSSLQILQTTNVQRFYTEERKYALNNISFKQHSVRIHGHRIGKISCVQELDILEKINKSRRPLALLNSKTGKEIVYYQEACRYWMKAIKGTPYFKKNGQRMNPPHGRFVQFVNEEQSSFTFCLLTSSLFYWIYSCFSDCEHVNDSLIMKINIPTDDELKKINWILLSNNLLNDFNKNSNRKTIKTKVGDVIEYDEFKISKSKSQIDEIDKALSIVYDFSDVEMDYIRNYDIKYRMGKELDEED